VFERENRAYKILPLERGSENNDRLFNVSTMKMIKKSFALLSVLKDVPAGTAT